jgi:K+ transporter
VFDQVNWKKTLSLALQSLGVVYGDIGTSPLYAISSTFNNEIGNVEDVLGVLSLFIYTIALIPMLKYVFIVLWANDNGDGKIYIHTFSQDFLENVLKLRYYYIYTLTIYI